MVGILSKLVAKGVSKARKNSGPKQRRKVTSKPLSAKEKQSFIEGRIAEIESKLSNSEIIDVTKLSVSNKIIFGSTVTLLNIDNDNAITYKIVGEDESDIDNGLLSYKSPLSRAMIGKSIDDLVELKSPENTQRFQVTDISYH